jgi:hypothetical protein
VSPREALRARRGVVRRPYGEEEEGRAENSLEAWQLGAGGVPVVLSSRRRNASEGGSVAEKKQGLSWWAWVALIVIVIIVVFLLWNYLA